MAWSESAFQRALHQDPTAMTGIRLSGVIFDLDGTLVDSLKDIATAVNLTRADLGMPALPEEQITRLVGDGAAALVRKTVPVPEREQIAALTRCLAHYELHALDTTRLYPGMEALLARLSARPMAVVTNKNVHLAERVLVGLGVRDRFALVLGGDSLPLRKPDPAPIRAVLERLGLPPQRTGMVGDGVHDVAAGRAAGVVTIAVTYGVSGRSALEAEGPDLLVDTVKQLDRVLL